MKRISIIISLIFFSLVTNSSVLVNEQNFPDAGFREYIVCFFGEELSDEEILATKELDINLLYVSNPIYNLKGIEYFAALEKLTCNCYGLTSLDLSALKNLKSIAIQQSKLTSLDLSKNTRIETLVLQSNNLLESLNISNCANLESFTSVGVGLKSCDFSNNTKLKNLEIGGAPNRVVDISADLSTLINLEYIYLTYTAADKITLPENAPHLKELKIIGCNLSELDPSKYLHLKHLVLDNNRVKDIDVSNNIDLVKLSCHYNQLTQLNLLNNPNLEILECSNNQLTELDVSSISKLRYLNCESNQIENLNVSVNSVIENIYCSKNRLTELDLTGCSNLFSIDCSDNYISMISLNSNIFNYSSFMGAGGFLYCYSNRITLDALNALVDNLPYHTGSEGRDLGAHIIYYDSYFHSKIREHEENECNIDIINKAKAKNWFFYDYLRGSYKEIDEKYLTEISHIFDKPESNESTLYDLSGRRLNGERQRGIYIKNGKKVMK